MKKTGNTSLKQIEKAKELLDDFISRNGKGEVSVIQKKYRNNFNAYIPKGYIKFAFNNLEDLVVFNTPEEFTRTLTADNQYGIILKQYASIICICKDVVYKFLPIKSIRSFHLSMRELDVYFTLNDMNINSDIVEPLKNKLYIIKSNDEKKEHMKEDTNVDGDDEKEGNRDESGNEDSVEECNDMEKRSDVSNNSTKTNSYTVYTDFEPSSSEYSDPDPTTSEEAFTETELVSQFSTSVANDETSDINDTYDIDNDEYVIPYTYDKLAYLLRECKYDYVCCVSNRVVGQLVLNTDDEEIQYEKAMVGKLEEMLLTYNFIHNDVHDGNILYCDKRKDIKFVDLGCSMFCKEGVDKKSIMRKQLEDYCKTSPTNKYISNLLVDWKDYVLGSHIETKFN